MVLVRTKHFQLLLTSFKINFSKEFSSKYKGISYWLIEFVLFRLHQYESVIFRGSVKINRAGLSNE